MHRSARVLVFTLAISATAAAQPAPPADGRAAPDAAQRPGVNHAVGYYDPALRRVVLVSGAESPAAGVRDRVWSWSGQRWELVTDSGPPARGNAGAAYDARRRAAVVTGGARRIAGGGPTDFEIIGESWEGTPAGWRPLAGADIAPRDHNALVYDERRQALLMFGGIPADRGAATWPGDTWALRPEGWARVATEGPAGRGRTALAYDGKRRQVVLFGGVGAPAGPDHAQPFYDDTWLWNGSRWRKAAEGGPPGRYAHGMVFDERAGVVLLYSGSAKHSGAPLTDLWQWDGRRWTEIPLTGPTPGHRYQPVMVYDRARGVTVLFGGLQGASESTWEWDGRQWREIRP